MTVIAATIGVLLALAWLVACAAMAFRTLDGFFEEKPDKWRWAVGTALIIAVPVGFAIASDVDDPYGSILCLRGHQEWTQRSTGKSTYTVKVWACDQYEAR